MCGYASAQNYNFQSYTVENGIPQQQVNTIFSDSRGYIWFGTAGGGICKFDGHDFHSYAEKEGLGGPIVNDIIEDKEGNIWVASTWGGLSRYDGKEFFLYAKSKGFDPGNAQAMLCDTEGTVWAAGAGLWKRVGDRFQRVDDPESPEPLLVNDMVLAGDGSVWIATNQGAVLVQDDELIFKDDQRRPALSIGVDMHGSIWAALVDGGVVIADTPDSVFEPFDRMAAIRVQDFFLSKDSVFWFSTQQDGVYNYDGTDVLQFNTNNGLTNNNVVCIAEDREGDIWLGTQGSGALKFSGMAFTYFDFIEGLQREDVFAIMEDDQGNTWVGTATGGAFMFDGVTTTNYSTANGLPSDRVRDLIQASDGAIWMATELGAVRMQDGRIKVFTTADGLRDNNVRTIVESANGGLWFGTYDGIAYYDGSTFTTYSEEEGLPYRYVHSLYEDRAGKLWIGTGRGLHRYDGEVFTDHSTGLCNSYVGSIVEDDWGQIWVHTDRCVSRFNGQVHRSFNEFQGLSSNTVYLIQNDMDGNIWVGTNRGIDRISFDQNGKMQGITNYSKDEGFKGIECNTRASNVDGKGNLWFGTAGGVIKFSPALDVINTAEPSTHITGVKLNLEETDWSQDATDFSAWHHLPTDLCIPFYKNYLSFSFVGISMRLPDRVTYQYMLEGFDKGWLPISTANQATYSNLPPGKYTFKVKSANEHGVWNQNPTEFSFEITPPFWQRWWFTVTMIGLFILGIYILIRSRTKSLNKQKLQLEDQVNLRVAEIIRQNKEKEVMLKEIHHRVKNNLQIINSLISLQSNFVEDEKALALFDECRSRVNSMALIHEKMYEAKDLANINVKEYVTDLVENLIPAYGLNQNIVLNFNIEVTSFGIDTIVPFGLLINEIVSNSLKYAFDKDGGTIIVRLRENGDSTYLLEIGDDGKGFPDGFKKEESETLGLQLVDVLTEQLGGTYEVLTDEGIIYRITFTGVE